MALADAFFFLGTVHSMSGHYVRARSNLHHALELSEAVHYELIQGDSLAILAIQAQAQGETLTALELFKQAVKILRAAGDPTATAWALSYYSAAAHAAGDSAQAVRLAQESLQLS